MAATAKGKATSKFSSNIKETKGVPSPELEVPKVVKAKEEVKGTIIIPSILQGMESCSFKASKVNKVKWNLYISEVGLKAQEFYTIAVEEYIKNHPLDIPEEYYKSKLQKWLDLDAAERQKRVT